MHVLAEIAAVVFEYLPGVQRSQPADPFIVLKVPALHSTQPAPFGPEYPLLQIQSVI